MKSLIVLSIALLAQSAFSEILNSDYDARHISLIEKTLREECGFVRGIIQYGSTSTVLKNDESHETHYTTLLTARTGHDQSDNNEQAVEIKTVYVNTYNSNTPDLGLYLLEDINCNAKLLR